MFYFTPQPPSPTNTQKRNNNNNNNNNKTTTKSAILAWQYFKGTGSWFSTCLLIKMLSAVFLPGQAVSSMKAI